jgi:hypothetical protein
MSAALFKGLLDMDSFSLLAVDPFANLEAFLDPC